MKATHLLTASFLLLVGGISGMAQFGGTPNLPVGSPYRCDGRTNNGPVIQAAINRVTTDLGGPGGEVVLPAGMCVTGKLIMQSGVHLKCPAGTVLRLANGTNDDLIQGAKFASLTGTNSVNGVGNWSIEGCELDGNNAANTGTSYGIRVYGWQFRLKDVLVHNFITDGIYSEWSNSVNCPNDNITQSTTTHGCMEAYLDNVKTYYNGNWGVTWNGPHDSVINALISFYNGTGEFRNFGNGSIASFTNSHAYGKGPIGFQFNQFIIGSNLYGEGHSQAQFEFEVPSSILQLMIASNCPSGSDGVLFGNGAADSYIVGGACSVNFGSNPGPANAIQLNTPFVKGTLPPNINPAAVMPNGIWQNGIVSNCAYGIASDASGSQYCVGTGGSSGGATRR